MDRRCTNGICLAFAGAKSVNLDLPLATVLHNPRHEWNLLAGKNKSRTASAKIDVDWTKFTQERYLFSHASICASVEVEEDGHTIKPACNELVNNNGNAWTNQILKATFKSFIGAQNFLEHDQDPEKSKGTIIDTVLRPVRHKDSKGRESDIFWADILIATDRKHEDLVADISSGKLTTMSMGGVANYVTCSRCGKVMGDNDKNCVHIENQLLQKYSNENGEQVITAELCGRMVKKNGIWVADEDSWKFIEASWVKHPAFVGAVINHYVGDITPDKTASYGSRFQLFDTVEQLQRLKVADRPGAISLRVAIAELKRMKHETMIDRVAGRI
jgi:hypothetical protein